MLRLTRSLAALAAAVVLACAAPRAPAEPTTLPLGAYEAVLAAVARELVPAGGEIYVERALTPWWSIDTALGPEARARLADSVGALPAAWLDELRARGRIAGVARRRSCRAPLTCRIVQLSVPHPEPPGGVSIIAYVSATAAKAYALRLREGAWSVIASRTYAVY